MEKRWILRRDLKRDRREACWMCRGRWSLRFELSKWMIYDKTKNKCFSFRTVVSPLSFPSPGTSGPSLTAALWMPSLCSDHRSHPSADRRSLCFLLNQASLDLHDSSLSSTGGGAGWTPFGLVSCCSLSSPSEPALPLTSPCTFYPCITLRFPYSSLMDGQKKWVNNSTSSGF